MGHEDVPVPAANRSSSPEGADAADPPHVDVRMLLDLARDAIVVHSSPNGRIVFWNQGATRMYGWRAEEAIGKLAREVLRTESLPTLTAIESQLAEAGRWEGTLRQRHRDGHLMTVAARLVAPKTNGDGGPVCIGIYSDVSNQSEAETRLSVSEGILHLFVSAVKDYGIFMLDTSGRIVTWNEGASRIKGYPATEIIGRHFSMLYTDEDQRSGKPEELLRIARSVGRVEDEGWRVRKDGSKFWADVVITALRDSTGVLRGYGKVTRDLTARRQAELDRLDHEHREAQALRAHAARLTELEKAKSDFLNLASHELRTPLAVARGYTSLLLDGTLSPLDFSKGYARIVEVKLAQIEWLVQKMLEAARLDQDRLGLDMREVDIVEIIHDQAQAVRPLLSREHELRVDIDTAADLTVRGDGVRLSMVLQNLLDNAIKYSPRGGLIQVKAFASDAWVFTSVSDQGVGIRPEDLPGIFTRLTRLRHPETAHVGGTGLGLFLCREIARVHGGDIVAESSPAMGSRFTLNLPRSGPGAGS